MAKCIKISGVKALANKYLRESDNESVAGRTAIKEFVGPLLMDAGAYQGFLWLEASQVPAGNTCGIVADTSGQYPDTTRIRFI